MHNVIDKLPFVCLFIENSNNINPNAVPLITGRGHCSYALLVVEILKLQDRFSRGVSHHLVPNIEALQNLRTF